MQRRLTIESIRKTFDSKGAELLTTEYMGYDQKLYFRCSCGNTHYTTVRNYRHGVNTSLKCKQCFKKSPRPSFESVKQAFEDKGAELLDTEYINNTTPMIYKCPVCGKPGQITYAGLKTRRSPLKCHECMGWTSIEKIRELVEAKGAHLISTSYKNRFDKVYFNCAICGKEGSAVVANITRGEEKLFYCEDCKMEHKRQRSKELADARNFITIDFLKELFKSKGAELLTDTYINHKQILEFKCSKCGRQHYISWQQIHKGDNENFLCPVCYKGNCFTEGRKSGKNRTAVDGLWQISIKEFYRLREYNRGLYSSHHIHPFAVYHEEATSFTNGFPLLATIHSAAYIEGGVKDPVHSVKDYLSIINWPPHWKMLSHTYEDFRFLDLQSYMITEIITVNNAKDKSYAFNKKECYHREGKLYIPIFLEELFSRPRRELVYSMIRNRLAKKFPDIYRYTNTNFHKYGARKLFLEELSYQEAREFMEMYHIQGMVRGTVYIGLRSDRGLEEVMILGDIRPRKKEGSYELLRLATRLNTQVMGGAQKLFTYFIRNYNPQVVISYCDVRWSSFDPQETVYPKLGFKYESYSRPNYKYMDPNTYRLYARQQFQKHKLKDKLENFNPELTEKQNMELAGYVRQYDCGNFKFVWKAE